MGSRQILSLKDRAPSNIRRILVTPEVRVSVSISVRVSVSISVSVRVSVRVRV